MSGIVDINHRCMFQSHGLECRAEVFRGIVRQEVAYFDEAETGVLTSRLGSDCHAVARAAATNINVALRNSLQCIGKSQTSNYFPCKSVQMSAFRGFELQRRLTKLRQHILFSYGGKKSSVQEPVHAFILEVVNLSCIILLCIKLHLFS